MNLNDLKIGTADSIKNKYFINIKGTNGTGKTSIIRGFLSQKFDTVMWDKMPHGVAYTCIPAHDLLVLGSYRNVCGGCDLMVKSQIVKLLTMAWVMDYNVIFEGVLVGDSKVPYYELMKELSATYGHRPWGFAFLDVPVDECLRRVQERNGGKSLKNDGANVIKKWNRTQVYRKYYLQQGDCVVISIDGERKKERVFYNFLVGLTRVQLGELHVSVSV